MRRRFQRQQNVVVLQAKSDYKHQVVRSMIEQLKPINTFLEIADLIGKSHEFVRSRLVKLHKNTNALLKVGPHYQVPKGVAEEFIRSIYGV